MMLLSAGMANGKRAHGLMQYIASVEPRYVLHPASMENSTSPNREGSSVELDEVLMQRYQHGSAHAFRVLYERHRSPLLRFVKHLAPGGGEEEEIAQETWVIARRRVVDHWRRRGRLPEFDSEALDSLTGPARHEPDNQAYNAALGVDMLVAIGALPLPQREAFLLRAEGGLSIDEIAAVTGANRETAKSRLRFALSRLRTALESRHGD